jgi:NTE family protein
MTLLTAALTIVARKLSPRAALTLAALVSIGASTARGAGDLKDRRPLNRVLILGGGGPVGEAWESGVIVALKENGIDLARTDLIVGTSAGAIVGARLASQMATADFIDAALAPADAPQSGRPVPAPSGPPPDLSFLAAKLQEMGTGEASRESISAEIGKWAQKAHPVISEAEFVASYQRRFPDQRWPSPAYECVTVDANDGSLRIWDASSSVPLALAVASSCALPGIFAPLTINGHRYMDGGVRSVTNADLARGCKTAVILAPTMGLDDPLARDFTKPLDGELQILRDSGCRVELIAPDAASLKAFGASIGNENHRAEPFNAGRIQGRNKAREIPRLWRN